MRDLKTGGKVRDEVLEEMREALAARCHLRPRRERSAKKGLDASEEGEGKTTTKRGRRRGRGVGRASRPGGLFDGPPLGDRSPLVSEYSMDVKMQGMSRAHGGEVLERMMRELELSKRTARWI